MSLKRKTAAELAEEIQRITEEYEKLAKEQKDRILLLRDENRSLVQQLKQANEEKAAIAAALIRAERTSLQIIEEAKNRSEGILADARRKESFTKQRIKEGSALLEELAERCESISKCIDVELEKTRGKFYFELISKKQA